nr:hypothetical protein [Bradyrhizobium sp. ORS 278]
MPVKDGRDAPISFREMSIDALRDRMFLDGKIRCAMPPRVAGGD